MPGRMLSIKSILPRSFFGRAVLIVVIPVLVIQIILSVVFVQRHYERVTQQMTGSVLDVVKVLVARIDAAPSAAPQALSVQDTELTAALDLKMTVLQSHPAMTGDGAAWHDLAGQEILALLRDGVPGYLGAVLRTDPDEVVFWAQTRAGVLQVSIPRNRLSPLNPHQLLVLVFVASLVLVVIAVHYLRLQIRPIRRLGAAAEAYGRGDSVQLRVSGAREIRAAALAFMDMRNRIDRQNAQRRLMLSGLGHDMRTPLTRMRLILSMTDPSEDRAALETEIADLEKLLNRFLDYARDADTARMTVFDPAQIVTDLVARYRSAGHAVLLDLGPNLPRQIRFQEGQLPRALDNILSNALDYGTKAHVALTLQDQVLTLAVEDDGPGISPADRARACEPFVRLDTARNQNAGAHVGLGLAIAQDAMRRHGGKLILLEGANLGGLRVLLQMPLASVQP